MCTVLEGRENMEVNEAAGALAWLEGIVRGTGKLWTGHYLG